MNFIDRIQGRTFKTIGDIEEGDVIIGRTPNDDIAVQELGSADPCPFTGDARRLINGRLYFVQSGAFVR